MAALQGSGVDGHYYDWTGKEAERQSGPVTMVAQGLKRRLND